MYKLVVFDWDGTLTPQRASSADDDPVVPLPGTQEKLRELDEQGVRIAVATNQRALGEGRMSQAVFDRRVRELCDLYPQICQVNYAVTDPERIKPGPGMLIELMDEHGAIPSRTLFIGNAQTDLQAAQAAGCVFALAEHYFGEPFVVASQAGR